MKKIYIIFIIILSFIPIFKVNAMTELSDPLECFSIAPQSNSKNIFINDWSSNDTYCGFVNNYFWQYDPNTDTSSNYLCSKYFIPVESNTTYTFTHFNTSFTPIDSPAYNYYVLFDENLKKTDQKQAWFGAPFNFTTSSNAKYFLYCTYIKTTNTSTYEDLNLQLELGPIDSKSDLSYVAYEEYVEPEVPDEPDEPGTPEVIPDTTLDDFYSIYLDKLSSLSKFATENKFVLSAIVIILVLVCLELFLYLCKGGYYR